MGWRPGRFHAPAKPMRAVALDATGSGGPWGRNVTYAWALTDPSTGVMVAYDPVTASAIMTTATVSGSLTAGSTPTFALTVTGRGVKRDGSAHTDTAEVDIAVIAAISAARLKAFSLEDGDGNSVGQTSGFDPGKLA